MLTAAATRHVVKYCERLGEEHAARMRRLAVVPTTAADTAADTAAARQSSLTITHKTAERFKTHDNYRDIFNIFCQNLTAILRNGDER